MSTIKKIVDTICKIPGKATLEEIYRASGDKLLPVEPFSKKQTIADFILAGGVGYHSMLNGSLAEHIYEIKASYNGKPFTYGLPFSTLYATGYPLHRIIEGSRNSGLIKQFDRIDYVTLPLMDSGGFTVYWKQSPYGDFDAPPFAINAHYLNESGAKLLGAKDEGFFIALPTGKEPEGEGWQTLEDSIWGNRFFIDNLDDTSIMTVFTQKSTALLLHATFKERKMAGLFMVLYAKKGVLLTATGSADELDELTESIKDQAYTYRLG